MVGLATTAIMGGTALVNGNLPLGLSLMVSSLVFLFGFVFQYRSGNTLISSVIIVYALMILLVYLVAAGGVNNTGPLWIFMFAPVTLYIHGLKRGSRDIILFLVLISLIMFIPGNPLLVAEYSQEFKLRLVYSFLTITFLSAIYEYSRAKAYSNLVEVSERYEELSKIDPLTQLSNRRDALNVLSYEVDRSEREGDIVSVAFLDLDYFKQINDNFGHDAGDQVLIKVSELLLDSVRKQDTVARWGGEEFFLIFPRTSLSDAYIIAEKLREIIAEFPFSYKEHAFTITTSVGISEINPGNDVEAQIDLADQSLYQAKALGRNRVEPSLRKSVAS